MLIRPNKLLYSHTNIYCSAMVVINTKVTVIYLKSLIWICFVSFRLDRQLQNIDWLTVYRNLGWYRNLGVEKDGVNLALEQQSYRQKRIFCRSTKRLTSQNDIKKIVLRKSSPCYAKHRGNDHLIKLSFIQWTKNFETKFLNKVEPVLQKCCEPYYLIKH